MRLAAVLLAGFCAMSDAKVTRGVDKSMMTINAGGEVQTGIAGAAVRHVARPQSASNTVDPEDRTAQSPETSQVGVQAAVSLFRNSGAKRDSISEHLSTTYSANDSKDDSKHGGVEVARNGEEPLGGEGAGDAAVGDQPVNEVADGTLNGEEPKVDETTPPSTPGTEPAVSEPTIPMVEETPVAPTVPVNEVVDDTLNQLLNELTTPAPDYPCLTISGYTCTQSDPKRGGAIDKKDLVVPPAPDTWENDITYKFENDENDCAIICENSDNCKVFESFPEGHCEFQSLEGANTRESPTGNTYVKNT